MAFYVNETRLAAKLHDGDPNARTELFYGYFNRLYSFIFYCVGKESEIAEDITRLTFIEAINSVKEYPIMNKLYIWLLMIANRNITGYFNQTKNIKKPHKHVVADDPDSPRPIINAEFEKALYELPLQHRQIILMRYIEEIPVHDIGFILSLTPKYIETILNQAQNTLKDCRVNSTIVR